MPSPAARSSSTPAKTCSSWHPIFEKNPFVSTASREETFDLQLILSASIFCPLKDGQNSVRKVVDTSGNVVASYDYDAFGNRLSAPNAIDGVFHVRAFGEIQDPNLGFTYLRARWMDPRTGTFASRDPFKGLAWDPSSLHRYTYVGSRPTDFSDPSGEMNLVELSVVTAIYGIMVTALLAHINKLDIKARILNQPLSIADYGLFAAHVAFDAVLIYANLPSQVATGLAHILAAGGASSDSIVFGNLGTASAGAIEQALVDDGATVLMYTAQTAAPTAENVLFTAVGDNASEFLAHNFAGRNLYVAEVPKAFIELARTIGAVNESTVMMGTETATELAFNTQIAKFFVQLFQFVKIL